MLPHSVIQEGQQHRDKSDVGHRCLSLLSEPHKDRHEGQQGFEELVCVGRDILGHGVSSRGRGDEAVNQPLD